MEVKVVIRPDAVVEIHKVSDDSLIKILQPLHPYPNTFAPNILDASILATAIAVGVKFEYLE